MCLLILLTLGLLAGAVAAPTPNYVTARARERMAEKCETCDGRGVVATEDGGTWCPECHEDEPQPPAEPAEAPEPTEDANGAPGAAGALGGTSPGGSGYGREASELAKLPKRIRRWRLLHTLQHPQTHMTTRVFVARVGGRDVRREEDYINAYKSETRFYIEAEFATEAELLAALAEGGD